jgi:hypothetical protein
MLHPWLDTNVQLLADLYKGERGIVDVLIVALLLFLVWIVATGRRVVVQ